LSSEPNSADTARPDYTERLQRLESAWWKRLLNVQTPYRWNLQRLQLGFTLDVGCGVGRNLINLDGNGVGVDHNQTSVAEARSRGLTAMTPDDFAASEYARPGRFDTLLLAHVVEHMSAAEGDKLLQAYLPFVRTGGRIVVICPQVAGYRSDDTHVRFLDFAAITQHLTNAGITVERRFSFPFPAPAGRVFRYNEFVVVGRLPSRP